MNLLFVHSSNELYGADRSLLRLIRNLNPQHFNSHVALPNDLPYEGLLSKELKSAKIVYFELKLGVLRRRYFNLLGIILWGWRTVISTLQLSWYCRKHQIELIHTNSTTVFAGAFAAKLMKTPHVWHVHETITENDLLLNIIAWLLLHFSDVVLSVSGPTRDNLIQANPQLASKTQVLHNGIDPTPFLELDDSTVQAWRKTWGVNEDDILLGTIGRISVRKGQKELILAATQVIEKYPNVHIVFVGETIPGEEHFLEELKILTEEKKIQDKVHWIGFHNDISSIVAAFDVFILPSILSESFPTTVLEAMAAGKPVIASAVGGTVEQIDMNKTGFLVEPSNQEELTRVIIEMIKAPDKRITMGDAGRQRLLNEFTINQYVQGVETIYNELTD